MEDKKIEDLKGYHKNPRKITEKMFNLLGDTIKEYGDLSGIVVNIRTGEVIGGNQRTHFFKQNKDDVKIFRQTLPEISPVGTVAIGYVEYLSEKYNYREVDWDEKKSEKANIIANKVGGFWDNDVLANQFDIEDLKVAGFEDFELGFANEEIEMDSNDLEQRMDSYLDGNIRQIVLYYKKEDFDIVMPRLEKLMADMGVDNNTEVFNKLLDFYEGNQNK